MLRAPRGGVVVAALCVATLVACGGGDDDGSDGGLSTDTEVSADVDDVDVCALLTADEVEAATGYPVETTVASPNQFSPSCDYDLAGENLTVAVEIAEGPFAHSLYTDRDDAEWLLDFGSRGVYVETFRSLSVDLGDDAALRIAVEGGFADLEDPRDPLTELGLLAVDRL